MARAARAVSAVTFLILSCFSGLAQPLRGPATAQEFHSRARLLPGGSMGDKRLAGIEIALDSGYKTYWRNPGESGLPPRFEWSGSKNVAGIEIRWPAPSRYEDATGVTNIYNGKVVLPVLVKPQDAAKPVELALSLEYGICKEICIPARTELKAMLNGADNGRSAIEEALAKVPQPQALGAAGELSILSAQPLSGDNLGFSVTIRAPAGTKPSLFAEAPENWYVSTSAPDAANRVTVTVDEKPKDASGPVPLRLTLTAGGKAIETEVSLDGTGQPR